MIDDDTRRLCCWGDDVMNGRACRSHMIARYFIEPRGLLGWLAGQIMAKRPSNRLRNRWTLEQMAVEPHHRVMEFGCGPGFALSLASKLAPNGIVVGVDPSPTMLAQARRRNNTAVRKGQVVLVQATAEALPKDLPDPFDRVYSSNVYGFLHEPERAFKAIHDRMRPGGWLATTWLPRTGPRTHEAVMNMAENIEETCCRAGFIFRDRNLLRMAKVPAVCVLAEAQRTN